MASNTVTEQIRQKVIPFLPRNGDGHGLIAPLQDLQSIASRPLEDLVSDEFSTVWLLNALALDWLKYSSEDDHISTDDIRLAATQTIKNLLESDDWISPKLRDALEIVRRMAKKKPFTPQEVEVRIPTPSGGCRFLGWLAKRDQALIPVSSRTAPFVPILEHSLADPYYAHGLIDVFAKRLARLRDEEGVTCLCVIEKAFGPVGALSMLAALVSKLGLPACIYRAGYWPTRARLAAYRPKVNDKIAMVYDLLVTGGGLRQAARDIHQRAEGASVTSAVVLLGYEPKRDTLEIDDQATIGVEALVWYNALASQFDEIRTKELTRTDNVTVLFNGRRDPHSPALSRTMVGSPPIQGGSAMKTGDLVGIRFHSRESRVAGTYALVSADNGELAGLDDGTFIVSSDILLLLDRRGIPYEQFHIAHLPQMPERE